MRIRNVETGAQAVVSDDFKLPYGWVKDEAKTAPKRKTTARGRKAAASK